jgi:DNA primase large subunit
LWLIADFDWGNPAFWTGIASLASALGLYLINRLTKKSEVKLAEERGESEVRAGDARVTNAEYRKVLEEYRRREKERDVDIRAMRKEFEGKMQQEVDKSDRYLKSEQQCRERLARLEERLSLTERRQEVSEAAMRQAGVPLPPPAPPPDDSPERGDAS